jgi:hypothetical protein
MVATALCAALGVMTAGATSNAAVVEGPQAQSTKAPKATPRPRATRVPKKKATPKATVAPTATPEPASNLIMTAQRMSYDKWGRPAAMDNREGGCNMFNDSSAVLRLELSVQLTNNSSQAIPPDEYWVAFRKTNGAIAYSCVWLYENSDDIPTIQPGQSVNLTFMAFMEFNERVDAARFITKNAGNSAIMPIATNLPVPN